MNEFRYSDIINEKAPEIRTRQRMPVMDRAAQFSPFAAVVGHDAKVEETARRTDEKIVLDEQAKEIINDRIQSIMANPTQFEGIKITYFVPDERKSGGKYVSVTGNVRKIDKLEKTIILEDGTGIRIYDISEVELIKK